MKYWKVLTAAAMLLGLTACGGGGGDDKNDPPPSESTPPGVTIQTPVFKSGADGTADDPMMTVNFTVNDESGPVTGLQLGGTTLVQLIEDDKPLIAGGEGKPAAPVVTRWQSMFNKWRARPTKLDIDSSFDPKHAVRQATTNDMANNGLFVDNGDGSYTLKIFKIPFTSVTGKVEDIITDPVSGKPLEFDPSRTSRIGFQFTDAAGVAIKANPTYDWVPAGGTVHTRNMADTEANCYSCHDQNTLALHGGKRFEVKYCVTCHNPGTTGYGESYTNKGPAQRTFPLDMASMIHKIHRGKDLPSVNEGTGLAGTNGAKFLIYGNKDSQHLYAHNDISLIPDAGQGIYYPQDTRNCSTCHNASNPDTPDAKFWYEKPDARACVSCHDDQKTHHVLTEVQACTNCHADNNYKSVKHVHEGRVAALKAGAETLKIEVKHASYIAGPNGQGGQAKVDVLVLKDDAGISYDDLKRYLNNVWVDRDNNGDGKIDILSPFILLNWDNGKGNGLGYDKAEVPLNPSKGACTEDGSGLFQCTLNIAGEVPTDANLVVSQADWPLCVNRHAMDKDLGSTKPEATGVPGLRACEEFLTTVKDETGAETKVHQPDNPKNRYVMAPNALHAEFDMGSTPLTADQFVNKAGADMESCKNCHKDQQFHIGFNHAVKDFVQCTQCHNATRTSFYKGIPGDLKYHVHSYHMYGSHRAGAESGATHGATFPASQNNCENCHTKEQYNLPNQVNARPSYTEQWQDDGKDDVIGLNPETNKDDDTYLKKYYSPTLVACASCHLQSPLGKVGTAAAVDGGAGDIWADHMKENGAVFGDTSAEAATGTEECASCHAVGQDMGVDKVHNVFDFR